MVDEAVALAAGAGQRSNEGLARRVWGEVRRHMAAQAEGDRRKKLITEANLELERSLKIFQELGMEQEVGRSLLEMAHLHRQAERLEQARESAEKSRAIFEKLEAQGDLKRTQELITSLSDKA